MDNQYLIKIAENWFAAFNNHDLGSLLALYHQNAQHYSPKLKIHKPETQGLIKGKDSLREWWKGSFDRLPSLRYEIIRLTPFEDRIFMEYLRHVDGDEVIRVGETIDIENELIVSSRVYHS